jgi:hypothetical protein
MVEGCPIQTNEENKMIKRLILMKVDETTLHPDHDELLYLVGSSFSMYERTLTRGDKHRKVTHITDVTNQYGWFVAEPMEEIMDIMWGRNG